MVTAELVKFVNESRAKGLSDDQIRTNLSLSGWSQEDINMALSGHVPPPPPPGAGSVSVHNNAIMAALAYLGILIIIPFAVAKDDPFVKFHIKQGLVLLIGEVILYVLAAVFSSLMFFTFITWFIWPVISLVFFALIVVGIVNAVTGKAKELPVIGHLANKFNF